MMLQCLQITNDGRCWPVCQSKQKLVNLISVLETEIKGHKIIFLEEISEIKRKERVGRIKYDVFEIIEKLKSYIVCEFDDDKGKILDLDLTLEKEILDKFEKEVKCNG